jgi:uncharacterized protein YqeY
MDTRQQIDADLVIAIKSGDRLRTDTLRGLKSAIKYAEIEAGAELDEQELLGVIAKQAKQRRDSIQEFKKAGRTDLVEQESAELALLEQYLPTQMSEDEIRDMAQAVISELGVTDMKGMGQVMQRLMADTRGQADGKLVSGVVRQLLSS